MRSLLILLALAGVAVAKPAWVGLGFGARNYIHAPAASYHVPVAITSQYHAQDELGQYSYGYAGGPSAKSEVKSWDGVTRGGYSYVDAEGKVQSVNYVADPVHGFRVAATNLPVAPEPVPAEPLEAPVPVEDTPEVADAKKAHFALYEEAKAAADAAPDDPEPPASDEPEAPAPADVLPASVLSRDPAHSHAIAVSPPIAYHAAFAPASRFAYSYVAPDYYPALVAHKPYAFAAVAPAPISYAVPHVTTTQYHAQDGFGQYSYGYAGGPSAKGEVKTFDGVTRGGYSYVDAEGKVQSVNYVADPVHGFRVAATNLPVAPVAPEPVPDTPEVAEAKAKHLAAVEEAKSRVAE